MLLFYEGKAKDNRPPVYPDEGLCHAGLSKCYKYFNQTVPEHSKSNCIF